MSIVFKDWTIEAQTGYKPKTTFYMDFSIAEPFGRGAIQDTFDRAFKAWKDDKEYGTELAMVLNWKSWEHQNNPKLCRLYVDLYYHIDGYINDNWDKNKLQYYYETTD